MLCGSGTGFAVVKAKLFPAKKDQKFQKNLIIFADGPSSKNA